ncbi:hypothetical protein BDW71DRAFT_68486 [Aspergillus fruticulosus]
MGWFCDFRHIQTHRIVQHHKGTACMHLMVSSFAPGRAFSCDLTTVVVSKACRRALQHLESRENVPR